jgi:hypothetical protein
VNLPRILKRLCYSIVLFILITGAGYVAVFDACASLGSHTPVPVACDVALSAPLAAAVASGLVFGWRMPLRAAPLGALAVVSALSTLYLSGHLTHWYGVDLGLAVRNAMLFCLVPSLIAAIITAVSFPHIRKDVL